MIELRVLGTLDLRDGAVGRPVTAVLAQPKRSALLAYLAAAIPRGPHRRESLLLLFWPNSTEDRARNSLNQAVFNLRRSLGETVILGAGEELRVNPELVRCDAVEFDEALARGDRRQAVSLYGGDLLPGFHLDECIEFERWLDVERERLRSRAVAAALELASQEERAGNGVAAVELLRRATAWAPYEEAAVARLIRLLAHLGDRAGALREHDRFQALLEEMSLRPSAELTALALQIRRGDVGAQPPSAQPQPLAAGAVSATPPRLSAAPVSTGPRSFRRREFVGAAAAVALVIIVSVLSVSRAARSSAAESLPPLDRRRVLVAAFENRTGDQALEPITYMAADWIAQGLARSGVARVVPLSTVVQETPHLRAEGSAPERAVPTANRQFARRLGAAILVGGSYYRSGDSLVLQAQVVDVKTGELLRAIDEVRGSLQRPAEAMEELQQRSLGALATLFDARLESWPDPGGQPATLEAYRRFSDGMSLFMQGMTGEWGSPQSAGSFAAAAAKFEAAAATGQSFTTPLLWAAYAHMNSRNMQAAAAIVHTLETRSLSPWNKAVLDHIAAALRRDVEGEYQAARQLVELSPDSEWLWKLAVAALQTGRFRESERVFARIDPNRGWIKGSGSFWRLRAEPPHALGDHAAALKAVREGLAVYPEDSWLRTQELFALAALGRAEELLANLEPEFAAGELRALWLTNTVLEELRGHGRTAATARVLRRLLPAAETLAFRDGRVFARGELARTLSLAGESDRASTLYANLLSEQPGNAELRVRRAVLAAVRGDRRPAVETLQWLTSLDSEALGRTFPQLQLGYWGSVEGWRALHQVRLLAALGEFDHAVETLGVALDKGLMHSYLHLHDDPDFDPLRRHAGFQRLLRPRG